MLRGIDLYWLIPPSKRRACLFKESCSCHVYRITKKEGVMKGIYSLWKRIKQCRPQYSFYEDPTGMIWVILKDGTVVSKKETRL